MLSPAPTNFTQASNLSADRMRRSISNGRPGSAMMAFGQRLTAKDIEAVVAYVRRRFITGGELQPVLYHSEQNGWPRDHAKVNALAVPFARGDIPLDTPDHLLTAKQRAGKRLYMSSCVSCHDQGRVMQAGKIWDASAVSYPRSETAKPGNNNEATIDAVTGATPYADHDKPPPVANEDPQIKQGEKLFQQNCAFCHGADGSGKNWIGRFLQPHPANLTERQDLTLNKLQSIIRTGVSGTTMPAWESVFNEAQIQAVAAYVHQVLRAKSTNFLDSQASARHSEKP